MFEFHKCLLACGRNDSQPAGLCVANQGEWSIPITEGERKRQGKEGKIDNSANLCET
jgi:hypothetical protein